MSGLVLTTTAVCVLHFFLAGQLHVFELFAPALEETYNTTDVGAIGSTQMGLHVGGQFLSALFIEATQDDPTWGTIFLLAGMFVWFCGVFASTYTTTIAEFHGVYSTLVGVGGSAVYWHSMHTVMSLKRGTDYHSVPMYLVAASGALGDLVFSFAVAPSLTSTHWRGTLRITALTALGCALAAISTIAWVRHEKRVTSTVEPLLPLPFEKRPPLADNGEPLGPRWAVKELWFRRRSVTSVYWALVLSTFFSSFALMTPQMSLANHLRGLEMSELEVSFSVATVAVGTLFGKLSPIMLSVLLKSVILPLVFVSVLNVAFLSIWFGLTGIASAIAFALFYGFGYGAAYSLLMGVTHEFGTRGPRNVNAAHLALIPVTILGLTPGAVASGPVYMSLSGFCGWGCAMGVMVGLQGVAALVACGALYVGWNLVHK